MLTLWSDRVESLWEEVLPIEVRELPEDLAALDRALSDPGLLGPILERFRREVREAGRFVLTDGRPTIAMETYVRLMVLKARYRWGTGCWRCRTRSICAGSAGSRCASGCRTSRRSAS
jgi:hypothetical protein